MLAIGLAGALAATGAMAQTKQADKDSQKFIKAAIEGDIAEVDIGKLAQEKGESDAVKQFGAMLVKDHGAHKAKAEQVANELGVTPPTGSSFSSKATYTKLKLLSGDFVRSLVREVDGQGPRGRHQGIQEGVVQDRRGRPVGQGDPACVAETSAGGAIARETDARKSSLHAKVRPPIVSGWSDDARCWSPQPGVIFLYVSLEPGRVRPARLELFHRLLAARGITAILRTLRPRGDRPEPRHALRRLCCEDDAADMLSAFEHVVIVGRPFAGAAFGGAHQRQRVCFTNCARGFGRARSLGMIRASAHARDEKWTIPV